jgi:hypothetical protein
MNRKLLKTVSTISITFSSIIAMVLLPVGTAVGEQIYKVRFGEQTFNDYFNVGFKSFRYTERGYNSYYGANLLLVPCVKSTDTDCIDSLSYQINQSDIWNKAELDKSWTFPSEGVPFVGSDKGSNVQFTIKNRFPTEPDELNNYPAGGATSIFKAPKASSSPKFRLFVNFNLVGTNPDPNSEKVQWNQFIAQVVPINLEGISDKDKTPSGSVIPNFGNISNLKVKLRVNILNQILNGWIHSRTVNPEITYSRDVSTGSYVEISGGPLSVPTAEAQLTEAQYRSVWETPYMKRRLNGYPVMLPDPKSLWGLWNPTDGVEKGELLMWAAYEPYFSNVAVAERYMWKLVGQGNLNLRQFDTPKCVSDGKIDGILATNATQYSPTPPTYIESSQELAYQLAAPHFRNPNEEFKGSYSLIVSEKLAECIWGSDLSNANARVSILSNDGKSSVVTQTFKRQSGFYSFNINGFGFSAPTIRIKLTQDAVAGVPTPSNTPKVTVEKPATTKKSILCTKGKTTKKITSTTPKCPTGYKKVS